MAKNRMVNTRFWDDNYITKLDPVEKLLFLYFLTNPVADSCGIYEIAVKRLAFDTGIEEEIVEKILKKFEESGKIFYLDGWVFVKNFFRYQVMNPDMKKGAQRSLANVPKEIMAKIKGIDTGWQTVLDRVDTLSDRPLPNLTELELKFNLSDLTPGDGGGSEAGTEKGPGDNPVGEMQGEQKPKRISWPWEACEYLRKKQELVKLDKPDGANLKCAKLILEFFGSAQNPENAMTALKELVDISLQDKFHSQNLTSMVYLYGNLQKLLKQVGVKNRQAKQAEEFSV